MIDSKIEITELEEIANRLADDKSRWHFHIAAPGCRISQGSNGITFVLEDVTNNKVYRASATNEDLPVGKRLAARLHGSEVFENKVTDQSANLSPEEDALVEQAGHLSKAKVSWHHHMLFPDCAFNPNPGLWTLQLEGPNSLHATSSQREPKEVLAVIEKLFYAQETIG